MTEEPDISLLRPYLMTSGRAQPVDTSLEIEAQEQSFKRDRDGQEQLTAAGNTTLRTAE